MSTSIQGKVKEDSISGLTAKQQRFVEEYLIDLNATAAYKRAGYRSSDKNMNDNAYRLKNRPAVAEAIRHAQAERSQRVQISADRVIQEIAKIAFADPRRVMSWGPDGVQVVSSEELPDAVAVSVAEVAQVETGRSSRITVKMQNKLDALQTLGKHLGIFAPVKIAQTDSLGHDLQERSTDELRRELAGLLEIINTARGITTRAGGRR